MRFTLRCIIILFLFAPALKAQDNFYFPGEWEPHEAVWLGWEDFSPFHPVSVAMIKAMLPTVPIKMVAPDDSTLGLAKNYLSRHGIDTTAIRFYVMPDNLIWMRDHGGLFLVNEKGEIKAADFAWSLYGWEKWLADVFDSNADSVSHYMKLWWLDGLGKVDSLMAAAENGSTISSRVIAEGGALEMNGKGTLLLNEHLMLERNPGATKEFLESEFKRTLGVRKIIWMGQGVAEDPHIIRTITGKYMGGGTGGHTDEYVRFADPKTILLAWVDERERGKNPLNEINYQRMSENLRILEQATDQDGKPLRIIKVPLPDPILRPITIVEKKSENDTTLDFSVRRFPKKDGWKIGDTAMRVSASSYLNYFATNGVVLLPTYVQMGSSPEKEEKVRQIFAGLYPDRTLVFIECMGLNWYGGGMHCITQQQPKRRSASTASSVSRGK
jgi:agmatine deiminase